MIDHHTPFDEHAHWQEADAIRPKRFPRLGIVPLAALAWLAVVAVAAVVWEAL